MENTKTDISKKDVVKETEQAMSSGSMTKSFNETAQIDAYSLVFNPGTGKTITWSPSFCEITGHTNETMKHLSVPMDIFDYRDLGKAAEASKSALKGKEVCLELDLLTKDGRRIPSEFKWTTLQSTADRKDQICLEGQNLTLFHKLENMLNENEEPPFEQLEDANDAVVIVQERKVLFASQKLVQISGYSLEEVIGSAFWDFLHPEDMDELINRYKQRLRGEWVSSAFKVMGIGKDGQQRQLQCRAGRISFKGKAAVLVMVQVLN